MQNQYHNLTLGDLLINSDLQQIEAKSGQAIVLRRREFQLLRFLANNLNNVINKYAILDIIWELNSFVGSNTLEVHLSSLRRKIEQLSSQVRIETIRGVGYRLTTV